MSPRPAPDNLPSIKRDDKEIVGVVQLVHKLPSFHHHLLVAAQQNLESVGGKKSALTRPQTHEYSLAPSALAQVSSTTALRLA